MAQLGVLAVDGLVIDRLAAPPHRPPAGVDAARLAKGDHGEDVGGAGAVADGNLDQAAQRRQAVEVLALGRKASGAGLDDLADVIHSARTRLLVSFPERRMVRPARAI